MSRADVLRTIKDAEADAAATLAKAESEASNIVTKARLPLPRRRLAVGLKQTDSQQMVDDARTAAQKEADKVSRKETKPLNPSTVMVGHLVLCRRHRT